MKDKIPEKLKKLVVDSMERHAWNIGVSEYIGDINYMAGNKENKDVMADIIPSIRYLRFSLQIYPSAIERWKEGGDEAMEQIISHEIAHLATARLHTLAVSPFKSEDETNDAWEALTEIIGRLSNKLDKANKKLYK